MGVVQEFSISKLEMKLCTTKTTVYLAQNRQKYTKNINITQTGATHVVWKV